jgi:hypothetical protein
MKSATQDATAGERAREIGERPGVSRPNRDSTDPRFGKRSPDTREPVVDATNPHFGKAAA